MGDQGATKEGSQKMVRDKWSIYKHMLKQATGKIKRKTQNRNRRLQVQQQSIATHKAQQLALRL